MDRKYIGPLLFAAGMASTLCCDFLHALDPYVAQIIMYIGINIIMTRA